MTSHKSKYFLVAMLMCFQSVHASNSSNKTFNPELNFSETAEKDWKVFSKRLKKIVKEKYECTNQDNLISSITLVIDSNKNSCTAVECRFNSKFKDDFINLERKLNVKIDESNPIVRFIKDDENLESLHALKDRLSYLHQIKAIPNFIISRIEELTNLDLVKRSMDEAFNKVAHEINNKYE